MPRRTGYVLFLILLLALGLRLFHVTYPYLDHHSWRQTDTAAIARNFWRGGFNILRPELDQFGPGPGVVELELQVTPFLTALLYAGWGVRDWAGRIIPILFSLGSIAYFYRLVALHADRRRALLSAFVFAILPLNVFFSRVLMPESGALFFALAAVYHFSAYLQQGTRVQYILAMGFASLAFLAKLSNLYLLPVLVALAVLHDRRRPWSNRPLLLFVLLTLSTTAAYYGYMHTTADIRLTSDRLGANSWGNPALLLDPLLYQVLAGRLRTVVFTDLGLILLLVGLFLPAPHHLFRLWLLAAVGYIVLVANYNIVHSYYQLPLVPAGAFFIGSALDRLAAPPRWRPLAAVACAGLLALAIVNLLPMYGMYAYPAYEAARALRDIDATAAPVLTVPHRRDMSPEILYYADRKGWVVWPDQLSIATIERFRAQGAGYVVITDHRAIPADVRQYLNRHDRWQGNQLLIVRL